MPIQYLAALAATERTQRSNLHLGVMLAAVAGALNAGGFLAIGQYTSHMTGIVSEAADNLVLGRWSLWFAAVMSLLSFIGGSMTTAMLVNYAKRSGRSRIYTIPLLIEAVLLLLFGLLGAVLQFKELISISVTAMLLCYVMGLQNALITKVSNAEIRTTHLTGLVTDIGIELGKLFYLNRHPDAHHPEIRANRDRLRVHSALALSFFWGGVAGAMGFKYAGFSATIPLAIALIVMALAPALRG